MSLWELDAFKPAQFLGFIRAIPIPNTFAGNTWLPNQTVFDLEFEYILGANRRPVMAHVMGYDSEAPIAGRPGLGQVVRGELPPIKRKSRIGEKTILRFLQPRSGVPDVDQAIAEVFNDAANLVDSIQARLEWLKLQALSEDKVVYNEGGVQFAFDFGFDDTFQINLTNETDGAGTSVASAYNGVWSDPVNSNPVLDLQTICNTIQLKTGVRPGTFVCSAKTLQYLLINEKIRGMIRGTAAPSAILTRAELDTLFALYDLPAIVLYDVFVQKENADGTYSDVRTMAENKAFLLPNGIPVGSTLLGPTAESRVLYGTPMATAAPGIWGETYGTSEPPSEWTKVAAVGFPSIPYANLIGQMTLYS